MIKKTLSILLAATLPFLPANADPKKEDVPISAYEPDKTYVSLISDRENPERDLTLEIKLSPITRSKTNLFFTLKNHRTSLSIKDFGADGFSTRDSFKFNHLTKDKYDLKLKIDHPCIGRYKTTCDINYPGGTYHRDLDIGNFGPIGIFVGALCGIYDKSDSLIRYGNKLYWDLFQPPNIFANTTYPQFPINDFYKVTEILDKNIKGIVLNDPLSKTNLVNALNRAIIEASTRLGKNK